MSSHFVHVHQTCHKCGGCILECEHRTKFTTTTTSQPMTTQVDQNREDEDGRISDAKRSPKAKGHQVANRCGMCGSTAIDHTEYDCKQNRGVATPQDLFDKYRPYMYEPSTTPMRRSTCMHDNCPQCHGTGTGPMGACVHMISCPCPKCSPTMMMQVTT